MKFDGPICGKNLETDATLGRVRYELPKRRVEMKGWGVVDFGWRTHDSSIDKRR